MPLFFWTCWSLTRGIWFTFFLNSSIIAFQCVALVSAAQLSESAIYIYGSKRYPLSLGPPPYPTGSSQSMEQRPLHFTAAFHKLSILHMVGYIWLSKEALQIVVKRREAKGKGEKERYIHLNAEFQRIARRDKKAFLSDQCKEIEEDNRKGKTRDLFQEN